MAMGIHGQGLGVLGVRGEGPRRPNKRRQKLWVNLGRIAVATIGRTSYSHVSKGAKEIFASASDG